MFGELSKLFDRNFAIGYFLPILIFLILSGFMLNPYGISIDFFGFEDSDFLVFTTIVGLFSWIGGIVLLALNRDLYRLMEGYGTYNPLRLFGWFEKLRYRNALKKLEKLESRFLEYKASGEEFPTKPRNKRRALVRQLAVDFPEREDLLLPTPFGNALRSFESFPRVMYGLDSIPAWGRLLAVIPGDYISLMNAARVQVDLWVNLGVVFILLQIEYVALVYATGSRLNWWVVGLWVALGTITQMRATSAARGWGHFVKSAFDVFAPKLREALGIEKPKNRQEEFAQWQKYSQALVYRSPMDLPELKPDEERDSTPNPQTPENP